MNNFQIVGFIYIFFLMRNINFSHHLQNNPISQTLVQQIVIPKFSAQVAQTFDIFLGISIIINN